MREWTDGEPRVPGEYHVIAVAALDPLVRDGGLAAITYELNGKYCTQPLAQVRYFVALLASRG